MSVRVEFYGVARRRSGVPAAVVDDVATLRDLLAKLSGLHPGMHDVCSTNDQLNGEYLASINGRGFTTNLNQPVADGDCVLILGVDAGG